MKQNLIELKGDTDKSTIRAGDFNTPLSKIDPAGKESEHIELNNTSQLHTTVIYRLLHPTEEYFSSSHAAFTKQTTFWPIKRKEI